MLTGRWFLDFAAIHVGRNHAVRLGFPDRCTACIGSPGWYQASVAAGKPLAAEDFRPKNRLRKIPLAGPHFDAMG
ncbi:serine/threonine protein kinase [Anopheles sinensis]|uniref:Serine/threonine protein kinase n=1 Tax=Anopheles sinensis TaxID=74873 RepID=A0A084WH40_ANOSI|nr:serine/threonine protein kinase [Anopheles sinensis]